MLPWLLLSSLFLLVTRGRSELLETISRVSVNETEWTLLVGPDVPRLGNAEQICSSRAADLPILYSYHDIKLLLELFQERAVHHPTKFNSSLIWVWLGVVGCEIVDSSEEPAVVTQEVAWMDGSGYVLPEWDDSFISGFPSSAYTISEFLQDCHKEETDKVKTFLVAALEFDLNEGIDEGDVLSHIELFDWSSDSVIDGSIVCVSEISFKAAEVWTYLLISVLGIVLLVSIIVDIAAVICGIYLGISTGCGCWTTPCAKCEDSLDSGDKVEVVEGVVSGLYSLISFIVILTMTIVTYVHYSTNPTEARWRGVLWLAFEAVDFIIGSFLLGCGMSFATKCSIRGEEVSMDTTPECEPMSVLFSVSNTIEEGVVLIVFSVIAFDPFPLPDNVAFILLVLSMGMKLDNVIADLVLLFVDQESIQMETEESKGYMGFFTLAPMMCLATPIALVLLSIIIIGFVAVFPSSDPGLATALQMLFVVITSLGCACRIFYDLTKSLFFSFKVASYIRPFEIMCFCYCFVFVVAVGISEIVTTWDAVYGSFFSVDRSTKWIAAVTGLVAIGGLLAAFIQFCIPEKD